jgi:hypothetical protein
LPFGALFFIIIVQAFVFVSDLCRHRYSGAQRCRKCNPLMSRVVKRKKDNQSKKNVETCASPHEEFRRSGRLSGCEPHSPPPPPLTRPKGRVPLWLIGRNTKKKTEMCFSAKEEEELRTANPTQMYIAEAQRVMP